MPAFPKTQSIQKPSRAWGKNHLPILHTVITILIVFSYYINEKDEIRSIENPKAYFKFFLTKNDRYNCLQREAMNRPPFRPFTLNLHLLTFRRSYP
jgi:hypothetical protein